ncbi:hypothetical protein BN874_2910001 [Candidatus Contendobacter odensis Run_B_J11]|uniref:Uncharacterized protein n=1 Tax=Candidatus Contendobacter odensis Run_B_J11 TaxID=1400861 RepID=A0A7U7GCI6_9GAMM|nr:hypothetical protein BN874_2910001 [Candidatus Contendobacter odensis Run_B_J11]
MGRKVLLSPRHAMKSYRVPLIGILRRIAQRAQFAFGDRFGHPEGVPPENMNVSVDQRRKPRDILVPDHATLPAQWGERHFMAFIVSLLSAGRVLSYRHSRAS